MCGIVGYIGDDQAFGILLTGLKKIDYRGYDSFGIALLNGKITLTKRVGSIDQNEVETSEGNIGIAHTRWATHGAPTEVNAHPHINKNSTVAVVHNGIIENFTELKQGLIETGYVFRSATDTEVIAHLIDRFQSQGDDFFNAVKKTLHVLKGSSAVAAITAEEPDTIVAGTTGAPLNIGLGNESNYLSSDVISFLDKTNRVIRLTEGEMACVRKDGVTCFNDAGRIQKTVDTIQWSRDAASKEGYAHFMLKEINEQPTSVPLACAQENEKLNVIRDKINKCNRVLIVASGTSYHAGLVTQHHLLKRGMQCQTIIASEFNTYKAIVDEHTAIIAISQSGETADLLLALKSVLDQKPYLLAVTNVVGSSVTTISEDVLYINAGPEIGVASTKAYMGQIATLRCLLSVFDDCLNAEKQRIKDAAASIADALRANEGIIERIAAETKDATSLYVIGRGIHYPTALEAALKIKEISYIHAEGMPSGELKHGTLALIEKDVPAIVIAPSGEDFQHTILNAIEMKSRGAKIIGVSDVASDVFDEHIRLPSNHIPELCAIAPLQLLAYHLSVLRGNNPDKPRNLAKSVTVV